MYKRTGIRVFLHLPPVKEVILMPRGSRGQGAGLKRRIRTQLRRLDTTTCLIMRNRSEKRIPANWRELLVDSVFSHCDHPTESYLKRHGLEPRAIPRPTAHIALGSLPTGMVEFTLERQPGHARNQLSAIEQALRFCDVTYWPVPKPSSHIGLGHERFVNTGVLLEDNLLGVNEHRFNPARLHGIPEIDWRHLEQYEARRKKAKYLGVKTTCGKACSCRTELPKVWQLGWEMHY